MTSSGTPAARPLRGGLRFRDKLVLWFGGIVLASTLLAISLSYYNNLNRLIGQFGQSLIVVANAGADRIDPDLFQSLHDPGQMNGSAYRAVREQLLAARSVAEKSSVPLRFLYTMAPTDRSDTWRYVVDSQPEKLPNGTDNPDFSALGATEQFRTNDVIMQCLQTGRPSADADVKDYPNWGPLLSVAVPIRDRAGRIVGILGADAPALAVTQLRAQLRQTALICLALGMIVVVLGSSLVARQITRPIDTLVAATERVAEGDLISAIPSPILPCVRPYDLTYVQVERQGTTSLMPQGRDHAVCFASDGCTPRGKPVQRAVSR